MATKSHVEKVLAAIEETRPKAREVTSQNVIETVWVGKRVHAGPYWAQPLVGRSESGEWRPGVYRKDADAPQVIWGTGAATKALAWKAAQSDVTRWAMETRTEAKAHGINRVVRGIDR